MGERAGARRRDFRAQDFTDGVRFVEDEVFPIAQIVDVELHFHGRRYTTDGGDFDVSAVASLYPSEKSKYHPKKAVEPLILTDDH